MVTQHITSIWNDSIDPISAHLYILVLKTLLILTKYHRNIHGIETFKPAYLYTAYADDTIFLKKDVKFCKNCV